MNNLNLYNIDKLWFVCYTKSMEKEKQERTILIMYNNGHDMLIQDSGVVMTTNDDDYFGGGGHAGYFNLSPNAYDKRMKITYYTKQKKWTYRENGPEKPLLNPIIIGQIKKELKRMGISLTGEDIFDDIFGKYENL